MTKYGFNTFNWFQQPKSNQFILEYKWTFVPQLNKSPLGVVEILHRTESICHEISMILMNGMTNQKKKESCHSWDWVDGCCLNMFLIYHSWWRMDRQPLAIAISSLKAIKQLKIMSITTSQNPKWLVQMSCFSVPSKSEQYNWPYLILWRAGHFLFNIIYKIKVNH